MSKLTFYHQKRRDGALRTGVELNDERILENYEPGDSPQDSALLWFVDVRCSGEPIPSQPEAVRQWLLERGGAVGPSLRQLAEDLAAGIDPDWPVKKEVPTADGVSMVIYCSAIRRLSGREIAGILSALAEHWPLVVGALGTYEHPMPVHG